MKTSSYLVQALFHQSNHATDQFLESRSEALFQRPGKTSFIEVHQQEPEQQELSRPALVLEDEEDSDCSIVRPCQLGQSRGTSLDEDPPPTYDNSPGLVRRDILDLKDVQYIEAVSALILAVSDCANIHGDEGD